MSLLHEANHLVWIVDTIKHTIPNGRTHQWLYLKYGKQLKKLKELGVSENEATSALITSGYGLPAIPKRKEVKPVKLP